MLVEVGPAKRLGVRRGARLRFGEEAKRPGTWAGRRLLYVDNRPAFALSLWCGTCPFLFERLDGTVSTLSVNELQGRLTTGLADLDGDVVAAFATLLPRGTYVPMLLEVRPRLTRPADDDDYFVREQVATWGIDPVQSRPEDPRTPYYRTFEAAIDPDAHLYEFVVPMVPPSWNQAARVLEYHDDLEATPLPTAFAVSTLDICQPAIDEGIDYYAHWGLTHFLLDGHHKMQAAAESGLPLRLLSLLSVDASMATDSEVAALATHRGKPDARRPTLT